MKVHLLPGTSLQINYSSCPEGHSGRLLILVVVYFPVLSCSGFLWYFCRAAPNSTAALLPLGRANCSLQDRERSEWGNDLSSSSQKIHLRLYDLDGLSHQLWVLFPLQLGEVLLNTCTGHVDEEKEGKDNRGRVLSCF